MTDTDRDQDMLESLFEVARRDTAPAPSPDLLARMMSDAEAQIPDPSQDLRPAPARGGVLMQIVAALGGWRPVVGLALATVAGVWIGFGASQSLFPDGVDTFVGGNADEYLAFLDTTPLTFEEN